MNKRKAEKRKSSSPSNGSHLSQNHQQQEQQDLYSIKRDESHLLLGGGGTQADEGAIEERLEKRYPKRERKPKFKNVEDAVMIEAVSDKETHEDDEVNDVPYLDEGTDQSNSSDDSVFEMLEEEASPIAKDQTDERIVFNDKDLSFNTAKSKDKSKRFNIPKHARDILMEWLEKHFDHPYPSEEEKEELCKTTKLTMNQINTWFVNSRIRIWKPKVEPGQKERIKEEKASSSSSQTPKSCKDNTSNNSGEVKLLPKIRINPNNANVTRTNIVGSLPNGLPTPSTVIGRGNLPKSSVDCLQKWLFDNFNHPYPSDAEKDALATETSLTLTQVNNWFINARRRIWKPLLQKLKAKGLDKDELIAKGKLHEMAAKFLKSSKVPHEIESGTDHMTPSSKKRGVKTTKTEHSEEANDNLENVPSTPNKKRNTSQGMNNNNNNDGETLPEKFRVENFTKHTCREMVLQNLELYQENRTLQHQLCIEQQQVLNSYEEISSRNDALIAAMYRLEQRQEEIRRNNERLRLLIEKAKQEKLQDQRKNRDYFLIEDLCSSL
ncbi:hypothetical protein FDP41_005113 [Naegleria fowleri]|uniref:Homeobox domain-containing protein n=1 Tax=Naegleria fowleri TaxID=5763 RepID=A0A6A5BLM0_NAEFO|nr:uncharacterized protein FDP41_005113 [Naegleria fowleri]KAF0975786.1 hypothetical protein FDP41_005113 [Naegleria fowleri]